MHDLKLIRENPAAFDEGMKKRGLPPQSAEILRLDEEKRARQKDIEGLLARRNQFAKSIGQAKAKGEDVAPIMAESKALNDQIAELEQQVNEGGALEKLLSSLPNIPADDVPVGPEETANKILRAHGKKPEFAFKPKEHFELGEKLGLMDFERAAKISGSRFVVLKGALARLERALAGFFLDNNTKDFGYTEVVPPFLVRDAAMFGTGQLPKFGEDSFKTTTDHWLIATSEISLTNLVNDEILNEADLPLRYTAYTPCFRSEAGSAGKDTRGMIRQHQFSKVEMVSITHPDKSAEEHERMIGCAENILQKLGLHYQVVLLSTEAGFSNKKTYDIEVWLPGQDAFREISSCSNCGDFQARRMKARFRKGGLNLPALKKIGGGLVLEEGETLTAPELESVGSNVIADKGALHAPKLKNVGGKTVTRPEGKGTQFVHTLNGSGLPIGRTIVAILENYQQEDGSVAVPEALQPYMGGATVIK